MFKRITAMLLLAAMLISLLAGCAPEEPGSTTGQPEESIAAQLPTIFPEVLTQTLEQALILRTDSESCYVSGVKSTIEGLLPVRLGQALYLPAVFVAEKLGAQVTSEPEKLTVIYRENTLEITAETLLVNGTDIPLAMGNVFEETGILVPAEEYCQGLGTQLHSENGLILVGDGLAESLGAEPEKTQLALNALNAELMTDTGTALQPDSGYEARSAGAAYLALDPLNLPYSTEPDTLVACAGNLYVENLKLDYNPEKSSYTVNMTVYNYLGYCYGSVEVYDANDQLLELERINPYKGRKTSVVSTITDIARLASDTGKAIWNWDISYLNYRTDLNASKSEITVEVPLGGYIYLTCNPTHSMYSAFYNIIYAGVQVAVCASDASKALSGGDSGNWDLCQMLSDEIIRKLMEDPGAVVELAAEFERIFGMNSTVLDSENYLNSAVDALLDAFSRAEIDFGGLLLDTVKGKMSGAADSRLEALLTSMLPVVQTALTSWKLMGAAENLLNMLVDFEAVGKCRSIIIDISDWRTAYANFLKTRIGSGDRYDLLYLTDDNIPELVLLHAGGRVGSTATIYTYQNRQVVNIPGPYGAEISIGFGEMQYLEYQSSIIQGNVHEGYSSMAFMVLKGDSFQTEATFQDTELLEGGTENAGFGSYYYNGLPVTQAYYYRRLRELGIFNEWDVLSEKYPIPLGSLYEKAKYVSAYTSGWAITESGIEEVYFFGW